MIAQRKLTNRAVVKSDDAAVQAAVAFLSRPTAISYRWICECCGMVHTGAAPAQCESCGQQVSLAHEADLPREWSTHW